MLIDTPGTPSPTTTFPRFNDPHALERSRIDHQIVLLKQQIEEMQITRNALLPISSLPDEIFSEIFLIYRERGMNALLSLTWVCQHWRNVALSNASLWALIGPDNIRWSSECLTRAKESPLEGSLDIGSRSTTQNRALILSRLHRFRKLHLALLDCSTHETRVVKQFLDAPAPILQSVRLENMDIPNPLFGGYIPALRAVTLRSCRIPSWTSKILPITSLKYLALELSGNMLSSALIQSFPSSLPNLEVLVLHSGLTLSPIPPNSRVNFPNLKTFSIWNVTIAPVIQILHVFSFPSSTKLTVAIEINEDTGETVENIRHLLHTTERLTRCGFLSAKLYQGGLWDSTFEVQTSPDFVNGNPISIEVFHGFNFSHIISPLSLLPTSIKTLDLSAQIDLVNEEERIDLFCPLIHLEELTLETPFMYQSFVNFIINSTPQGGDVTTEDLESDRKFPLKALKKLTIRKCDLGPNKDSSSHREFRAFCSALGVRHEYGFGFEDLWVRL